MEKFELFKPKFSGQRFDDVTLPFELLEDISAYQDLLLQVAKDIYYQRNGTRKVPRGFGEGVYLKLGNLESGSTIPNILLAAATFFVSGVDTKDYFTEAQIKITNTISLAEDNKPVGNQLSDNAVRFLNKFGKHLKEDEVIYFSPTNLKAKFTTLNRRKIILSSPSFQNVENDVDVRGTISALNKDPKGFTIFTKEKIKISVSVEKDEYYNEVEKAFAKFENEQRVLISATGVYNKQNKLEDLKNIKSIVLLDKDDVPTQLEKFENYKDGWMNEEGIGFVSSELDWLANKFDEYYSRELLLPITFPTIEGGIEFEWTAKNHDVTLEVNLKDKTAYLHYLNIDTNEDEEHTYNLDDAIEWKNLNAFLGKYFKGQ